MTKKYCLPLVGLLIFSSCSSADKQKQLLKIQSQRIRGLQKQLALKEKQVSQLKTYHWVNAPIKKAQALAFAPLVKAMEGKQWIRALKISSELKKTYPDSTKLGVYRYKIFQAMGLKKQAVKERVWVEQQMAKSKGRAQTL